MNHLLCFGFGFSAAELARQLDRSTWQISATSRSAAGLAAIAAAGCSPVPFQDMRRLPDGITHVLVSAPPDENGDPVLAQLDDDLAHESDIEWLGYLSTTGVYGDHGGAWVDEATPLAPNVPRAMRRVAAEQAWQKLNLPVHSFRLAGIYGPGRNALQSLKEGTARRIIKPGQIFSRIHVTDIAGLVMASMAQPDPGRIYNCADDHPCPPQEVIAFAAELLGVMPPPEEDFATASMSGMARSFYADSKRVSNERAKAELGYSFQFPSYREGLTDILKKLRQ